MKKASPYLLLLLLIVVAAILWFYIRKTDFERNKTITERIETKGIPDYYLNTAEGDISDEVEEYKTSWRIHFLSVGQGDAILIQDERLNILIDGGDRDSRILDELRALAIDTLHWVIATHPHADHIAGLVEVLKNFPVINVLDSGVGHTSALYHTYRELVKNISVSYTRGYAGWSYSFAGDFVMEVLHPDTLTQYDINNSSMVLRIQMGKTSAIFTGDAEHEAEEAIMARGANIDSDIIKVGHHGSKTSSSQAFIEAVSPQCGVILCGDDNQYDFPHPEAVAIYQTNQTRLFRSDINGNVLFLVSDSTYEAFPEFTKTTTIPVALPAPLRVDINHAGIDSLTLIVHVGETNARRIIENRPYSTLDDLHRVKGLGPTRIAAIKEQGIAVVGE